MYTFAFDKRELSVKEDTINNDSKMHSFSANLDFIKSAVAHDTANLVLHERADELRTMLKGVDHTPTIGDPVFSQMEDVIRLKDGSEDELV